MSAAIPRTFCKKNWTFCKKKMKIFLNFLKNGHFAKKKLNKYDVQF